jgi:hypothetical protein
MEPRLIIAETSVTVAVLATLSSVLEPKLLQRKCNPGEGTVVPICTTYCDREIKLVALVIMLYTFMREVLVRVSVVTQIVSKDLLWFSSILSGKILGKYLDSVTTVAFKIVSNSTFMNYPPIRCYIF